MELMTMGKMKISLADAAIVLLIIALILFACFGCATTGTIYDLNGKVAYRFTGESVVDVDSLANTASMFFGLDLTEWLQIIGGAAGIGGLGYVGNKTRKRLKNRKAKIEVKK